MKTIARGLAVWLAAAALAPAEPAVPAEAPPAGRSFSLGVHLAYWDLEPAEGPRFSRQSRRGAPSATSRCGARRGRTAMSGFAAGKNANRDADGQRFEND